ncbi:hypothetical protein HO173_007261 [Letharia columbiana]|uniref:Uncharacterized protein n=1 Tax=Letharia columbiana TaxID=112416 RepID=A0A8H6FTS4_9LECA|nr:uncharacterized protein HO173_007261 [Letharia columbiana]KAF6234635.1 hypothetical protein HO173_007261 [Letharia columbiana]
MRLQGTSQVGGRGKTVSEVGNLRMPAWLAASPVTARYHLLSSFTSFIGVDNMELFDPAHLTRWSI